MTDLVNSGTESLPKLYAGWLTELLGRGIPAETVATCDDCAMCTPDGQSDAKDAYSFEPSIKCCTYVPRLASFHVGGVLGAQGASVSLGQESLEQRLRDRQTVSPLGVMPTEKQHALYSHGASTSFGRSESLLCPHYQSATGQCGIWSHRSGVCSTYFCKTVRGAVGQRFWNALLRLLVEVDRALSLWVATELEVGSEAMELLLLTYASTSVGSKAGAIDGTISDADYDLRWGSWAGRERAYFIAAADRVGALSWAQVEAICGIRVQAYAAATRHAFAALLDDTLPKKLVLNSFELLRMGPEVARVSCYDRRDPQDLPRTLLDLLHHFDGRPVDVVLASIEEQAQVELSPELLRRLVDLGILAQAD